MAVLLFYTAHGTTRCLCRLRKYEPIDRKGYDEMKKLIALALCLILPVSTGVTALAAPASASPDGTGGSLNDRLKAITLKVKETLEIGDGFTSFNGNLSETGTASLWSLSWSNDSEQIYVTANENGTVVNYSDYVSGGSSAPYERIPRFPAMSLDDAKAVADAFLAKVLGSSRLSVSLAGTSTLDYSGSAVYYLSGPLKLNGIETPVYISVSVSAATKKVASFYRGDDGRDYGAVTQPSAATDKSAASAALKDTLNMKLTYALTGDGTKNARLQYTPSHSGSFVVDAATGKLVNLSTLDYSNDYGYGYPAAKEAAMDSSSAGTGSSVITEVEQATIDQLQGVLSQSALESAVRAYPELGLNGFTLDNVSYYAYKDDGKETQVTASLQFVSPNNDEDYQYRSVSLDARTGELQSVAGNVIYYAGSQTEAKVFKYSDAQTEAVARSFAGKVRPKEYPQTALSSDVTAQDGSSARYYQFNRVHEGIPFPENAISVTVDAETGYVVSYYYNWYKDDVAFASPVGMISAAAAAEAFSAGAGTALRYVGVPESYASSGLLLAYTAADTQVWGVNALTGELLESSYTATDDILTYDDLAGNLYAPMIEKLASFGIGFPGESFKPGALLTQEDALVLIESTNGRKVMPLVDYGTAGDGVTDDIYTMAYSMGILTPEERNPAKEVSRAEFIKYLVNAMGYKTVASLRGIYKPGFSDDSAIPADLLGYMALGKGFGIINGDQSGNCRPNETATRVMAAVMLYNCMSRA